MFKTKKLIVSMCGILLAVLLFISLTAANKASYAEETGQTETQDNIICEATIEDDFADDSVLVVLDSEISKINKVHTADFFNGVDIERIEDLTARKNNFEYEENEFKQILQIHLKSKSKENVLKSISKIEKLDGVYSAEPNYSHKIEQLSNDPDLLNGNLWGLDNVNGIKAMDAWDITKGNRNIRVGVIDTGISNHYDLDGNLVVGWDTVNDNITTNDDLSSHGTHVAGTIGAVGNNGIGIVGVNWNVNLVPIQTVKNVDDFYSNEVIKAIQWAENKWGTSEQIDILNYSVGGFGETTAILQAIKSYHGLFVWAAGNKGQNVDNFSNISSFYLPNLISVGNIYIGGDRYTSSNYGKAVDIYAPGTNIKSTVPFNFNSTGYGTKTGTSMAAPHVTGVAALLLSLNKNISAKQLKKIILDNADSINITVPTSSGGTATQTVKKLNAYRAVATVKNILDSNKNKTFYFKFDRIHAMESSAYPLDNARLGFNNSFTLTAPENMTHLNDSGTKDVRNFTHWRMILNGPNAHDFVTNPWIDFTTDRTLSFTVSDIINNYYPLYETTDTIYFRAVYKTSPPSSSCIAEDSLITLADGSRKLVKDLTGEESLLVWNLFTGTFDTAPILCIDSETAKLNDVINLYFSDGTNVKVISEHGFWDIDENKYVYLDKYAAEYIGHTFYKQDIVNNELCSTEVELIDVVIEQEYTTAFSPVTYGHLCYFVNGMLSMPGGIDGLFNIFEVDRETFKYDEAAYLKDIETYGLYTYQEFSEILLVSEELFEAVNGQYLKVAIGKGLVDIDTLAEYIERYSALFD